MNQDIAQGKWKQIKGEIQKIWGDVTNDDLEKSKGNMKSISGILQEKYGHKKDEVSSKLGEIYNRFGERADDVKKSAAETTENIKRDLKKRN